ncbi:MAG: hypothetical protein PHU14_11215, partial [Methylovulum sp.]|nr:hypothetical protein [Methylovulum sp.]
MMAYGFSNAALPALKPLVNSDTFDAVEADLQNLFMYLFNTNLASDLFDANVLANPQLGSMVLVRKALDEMGVSVINQILSDNQVRLIHKSWAWPHRQKRGLFMLRTLLQIIYQNGYKIEQYWHPKDSASINNYPNEVFLQSQTFDVSDTFLTSRILVTIPLDGQPYLSVLKKIALSIVPA